MTREEFEHMVNHTGPEVYAFCLQLARCREEAQELYQETMLAATERRGKIDRQSNPKSYLLGIAAGLWKNRRRKLARRSRICPQVSLDASLEEVYPASEGRTPQDELVDRLDERERLQRLRRLVEELPQKQRVPLYLYYSRELSVEEIASALHIPKGTVKSRLHKARTILKERLECVDVPQEGGL